MGERPPKCGSGCLPAPRLSLSRHAAGHLSPARQVRLRGAKRWAREMGQAQRHRFHRVICICTEFGPYTRPRRTSRVPGARGQGVAAAVQSEAGRAMIYLVSPDCVLYVIIDPGIFPKLYRNPVGTVVIFSVGPRHYHSLARSWGRPRAAAPQASPRGAAATTQLPP